MWDRLSLFHLSSDQLPRCVWRRFDIFLRVTWIPRYGYLSRFTIRPRMG
jgi:hypothetical protein